MRGVESNAAAVYVADGGVYLRRVRAHAKKNGFSGYCNLLVAARLFGSLTGFDDVPNKCFWRIVEYAWLGDWRHP